MSAIFKIDQLGAVPPIPPGAWDRARRDLQLFGTGGSITFTAQGPATTYLWELISQPPGSSALLVNPTTSICTVDLTVTGGYLIRLTVNGGLSTEDVCVRYVGIPLPNSGLSIPAFNECDFDNSIDPLAVDGWSEKMTVFFKWADTFVMPDLASVLSVGNSAGANQLNMNGNRVVNVGAAIVAGNALAYGQVGAKLMGLDTMGALVNNVGIPVSPGDAANKYYVDSMFAGLALKDSVRVSTIVPEVLANLCAGYTVDTVVLSDGDRLLVRLQAAPAENGIYDVHGIGVPPTRSADCAVGTRASGAWTIAEEGSVGNDDQAWLCTTDTADFGDPITFTQFLSLIPLSAGDGIEIAAFVVSGMVQHAGNPNGVLACNTLGYHVLDTITNTYYYCSVIGIAGVAEFTVIGPHKFGSDNVYIDASTGSDANGDGTPDNPYQTFVYACTQVADPTMASEFITPVTFYLAPGIYDGEVTLPQRLHITIVGDNCRVSQDMYWPINPDWWALYGLSLDLYPVLNIKRSTGSVWGNEGIYSDLDFPQGFILESGTLYAYNSNPLGVNPMPSGHNVTIDGALRAGFNIYNQPTGSMSVADVVGTLYLQLFNSMASPAVMPFSWVCGEADRDTGSYDMNCISVYAENSMVFMRGCCKIDRIHESYYHADRTIDHDGNPYAWGVISAINYGGLYENITQSMPFDECFFGFDPAAPAPVCGEKLYAIIFDKQSLLRVADVAFFGGGMYADFYGFDTTFDAAAFGRGWWWGADEYAGDRSVTRVPASDGFPFGPTANTEGMLLAHAYDYAQFWQPHNLPLTASNRLTIALEAGTYGLGDYLDVVSEFVDIIGMGGPQSSIMRPMGTAAIIEPSNVRIYVEHNAVRWYADDARMEDINIFGYGDNYAGESCMIMMAISLKSSFRNLTFGKFKYNLYAVKIDPALAPSACQASWQDCYTTLNGFLYGGNIAPVLCARCKAGMYSFGAMTGVPGDISVAGIFKDCEAGDYSFAAVRAGGNVTLDNATLERCKVNGFGFGHTSGGGGVPYTAICGSVPHLLFMQDCDNGGVANGRSFGSSAYGDATAGGTFNRCESSDYSFGASAGAAGTGTFGGVARDCRAGARSFGSNGADLTRAVFSGEAERCRAGSRSFGARGTFSGRAVDCRAEPGSFGWATSAQTGSLLERCEVEQICAALMDYGPPGVWGHTVRRCAFSCDDAQDVAPLYITGGTEGANDETKVYDCDLYTLLHGASIETPGPGAVDAQIAHCRMNVVQAVLVRNILGAPYNLVDAKYRPIW